MNRHHLSGTTDQNAPGKMNLLSSVLLTSHLKIVNNLFRYNFLSSSYEVKSLLCHGSDDMSLKGCQYKQVTGYYSYLGTNNISI